MAEDEFDRILKIDASDIVHGPGKAQSAWEFHIDAYRWDGKPGVWLKATEETANTWFLFGKKDDYEAVFGLFPNRKEAEKGMEIAKEQKQQEELQQSRGMRR